MKKNTFMKMLVLMMIVFAFTACKNDSSKDRDVQLLTDSTTFHNNALSDTATVVENSGSANRVSPSPARSAQRSNSSTVSNQNNSGNSSSAKQGTTQKKGWSKAAQGAVIGGATGAVGGAIISKNKGAGAAVGAAVGAAGGYIIGREKDKKDGRVKKKNQ